MDETRAEAGSTAVAAVPDTRTCTRCHGEQHLLGERSGMGKYCCDSCELTIGFDLDALPAEFLLSRGLPSRYTKDVFGSELLGAERRLP